MAGNGVSGWEGGFGTGVNVSQNGVPIGRVSAQGVEKTGPDTVTYRDPAGKKAFLTNLTPGEVQVLKDKHGI